ncbi:MAG: GNAT family N-acetyltransferase [Gemmatimonadota bacterium]
MEPVRLPAQLPVSEQLAHQVDEIEIIEVRGTERLDDVRALFLLYGESLRQQPGGADVLERQGFDSEVRSLPGDYAPPDGLLLLVLVNGAPAGCVGVRRLEDGVAELKRLYVAGDFRGHSLGHRLLERAMERASGMGYARMRLDTLPFMRSAMRLYRKFGFDEVSPYQPVLMEATRFFEATFESNA